MLMDYDNEKKADKKRVKKGKAGPDVRFLSANSWMYLKSDRVDFIKIKIEQQIVEAVKADDDYLLIPFNSSGGTDTIQHQTLLVYEIAMQYWEFYNYLETIKMFEHNAVWMVTTSDNQMKEKGIVQVADTYIKSRFFKRPMPQQEVGTHVFHLDFVYNYGSP